MPKRTAEHSNKPLLLLKAYRYPHGRWSPVPDQYIETKNHLVETGFVSEKSHFSFAVRESWKGREDCMKIASENGLHTKNGRVLPIFKCKKLLLIPAVFTYLFPWGI